MRRFLIAAPIATLCACVPCLGDAPGQRWAHITAPGNAPYTYVPPGGVERSIGRVDHEYYIRTTETTASEWFEFVKAAEPYMDPQLRLGSIFVGEWTSWDLYADGSVEYHLNPFGANRPVSMAWRYAAMDCNWLHHDKASNIEAFLTGAYTLETTFNDRLPVAVREPGARYWIPSEDEWVKAAYYDPNRLGPGLAGYWQYPITSDSVPISGLPENGGQTSAGVEANTPDFAYPEVGAYANVQSPWGLLDVSGGAREWNDTLFNTESVNGPGHGYFVRGSASGDLTHDYTDHINTISGGEVYFDSFGLRIASSIPSTGTALAMVGGVGTAMIRRRRNSM